MAFNDYQFIRTKMSPALEVFLEFDQFQPEPFETFVSEMIHLGHKVSCRSLNEGHTISMSVTGGNDTPNQNLILSAFGDSLDHCAGKLQALLALIDPTKNNWHHIEDEIKKAEKAVADLIRNR